MTAAGYAARVAILERISVVPGADYDPDAWYFGIPAIAQLRDAGLQLGPATVIVGENGTGKSTLLEGIAVLAGFDEGGGGPGYRAVDHSRAIERGGGALAAALKASWLPKVGQGWFFRAESFFSVARYLDEAAREPLGGPPPDFLSHSHGEGFMRFFEERCQRPGILGSGPISNEAVMASKRDEAAGEAVKTWRRHGERLRRTGSPGLTPPEPVLSACLAGSRRGLFFLGKKEWASTSSAKPVYRITKSYSTVTDLARLRG